jgi:hypothetical protein
LAASGTVALAVEINGINIDFTDTIPGGNVADTTGYGAVGYDYSIATNEISIGQFGVFIADTPVADANFNYWNTGDKTVGIDAPAVNINWYQAAMFCNWLTSGNISNGAYAVSGSLVTAATPRGGAAMDTLVSTYGTVYVLPTEDEWYKAAYFKDGVYSLYATGNTAPVQGEANFATTGGYEDGPAWTVSSGTNEQNGTKNMMGNVFEWLESSDNGDALDFGNTNQLMGFRGGDYFQGVAFLSSDQRGAFPDTRDKEYFNLGFRVAAIPEPGTMSLMSLSTVGLFLTRSVRRRKRLGHTVMPIRRESMCDEFCSEQEWRIRHDDVDYGDDILQIAFEATRAGCVRLWSVSRDVYGEMDKAFWNRMVRRYERKMERRAAIRKTVRKKALDCFDAFLARIMK